MPVAERLDYQEIFERNGIDTSLRNPQDYFFDTVPATSKEHAGEIYPIPRFISIADGVYQTRTGQTISGPWFELLENGSLASPGATIHPTAEIGLKCILFNPKLEIGRDVIIDDGSEIGARRISDSAEIGEAVFMALDSMVGARSVVEDGVTIEESAVIAHDVYIGQLTFIGARVRVDERVVLGTNNHLKERSHIQPGAVTKIDVMLDKDAVVGKGARLDEGSRVTEEMKVRPGRHIRKNRIVVPRQYVTSVRSSKYA